VNDRPNSLPTADGDTVIKEMSKEFNRSLFISNTNAPIKDGDIQTSGVNVNGDTKEVSSADKICDHPSPGESNKEPESKADGQFIAPKDFELLKVIGMGAFGKVLQVRNRHSSNILAMKIISKRLIRRKGSYVENILAERNILSKIANHPFIVTMHASFQTKEKLFIVMDFCAGGELFLKLGREGIFRERTAAFYLAEITLALEHLHSVNALHRDLKPENILLGSDGHCCLTDFGLAKDFTGEDDRARTLCGTIEYMAPEMVARKWYGKGADFWSLGCIAYEMLSGDPPFSSKKGSKELFKKIMNDRIRMPDGASAAACKLLKGLLNRDAGKRLGAARGTMFEVGGVGALKQQPFFLGLDWGKLELKEIDPPEDFSVDNDEDLRHFHDEFVNMNLPRSVKELSKLDFLPRHCKSQNFKGFSFIGDNFTLPERTASEKEHYWNNVDDDGQSLSDCASSVFDDDLSEVPVPEPVPEKKKRPPRKKKKQQQPVPPLETTREGSEANENSAADMNGVQEVKETDVHDKKNLQPPDGREKDVALDSKKRPPHPLGKQTNGIQNNPPQATSVNDTGASAPAKSLNPNAKTWGVNPLATRPAPQASMTKLNATQQANPVQPKPVAAPSHAPKPGTWASMAVDKGKSNKIQRAAAQSISTKAISSAAPVNNWATKQTLPKAPPQIPVKCTPSSDWRTHVASPSNKNISSKSTLKQNLIQPPRISQPGQSWPSLGDFPPPPRAKPKEPKQTKPTGAWGKT